MLNIAFEMLRPHQVSLLEEREGKHQVWSELGEVALVDVAKVESACLPTSKSAPHRSFLFRPQHIMAAPRIASRLAAPLRSSLKPRFTTVPRRSFAIASRMQVKKYTEDHEWIELDEGSKIGTLPIFY
jgi:hypothetical protein